MPNRRAMIGCCSSSNTALAWKRDVATASTASSARAQGLSTLAGRPVIVYGIARAFGALPNTASISGAAASRSGVTTRMSDGRGGFGPAKSARSWSCSTSSSRVSEWQT